MGNVNYLRIFKNSPYSCLGDFCNNYWFLTLPMDLFSSWLKHDPAGAQEYAQTVETTSPFSLAVEISIRHCTIQSCYLTAGPLGY